MLGSALLSLLVLTGPQDPAPDTPPASPVTWVADLETAHALAARDGKPVIAYFTFDT